MAVVQRSRRARYLLVVLILASITLITIDAGVGGNGVITGIRNGARDVFDPIERATHSVLQPVGDFFTGAVNYGSLRAENTRLRAEISRLENSSLQSAYEQERARAVLGQQHLSFLGNIRSVTGEVIASGSSNFEDTITVARGTSSGVAVGQPVVASGGLVGSVSSAGKSTSTVTLITDPTSSVGVRLATGNTGSAQGAGLSNPLNVQVLTTQKHAPIMHKRQPVFTSGLNMEKFPPGIPVGRVHSVTKRHGFFEPAITIEPSVNLTSLAAVQILLWSPQ